jgi:hypothetical protein
MIDRATPIAQQDAETYSNRAVANMNAVNTAGLANVGEQNKFGLQLGEQAFTAGENVLNRTFQTSEREAGQAFTAAENKLDRTQQVDLQTAAQTFQATENEKTRAADIMLADKNITANQALEKARQEFQTTQNELDRTQQITVADKQIQANKELQTAQQTFAFAQSELDRAQQVTLTDKSIKAQQDLATAQQTFTAAQAELDRTQQTNIANANVQAQKDLQTAQQIFTAAQGKLDRDQQVLVTNLQNDLSQANVSKTFAANLSMSTANAINAVAGDPNLSSVVDAQGTSPKQRAIKNVIDNANSTMQWGSTFYNTPLPKIGMPGSTESPGTLTAGGSAAPAAPAAPGGSAAPAAPGGSAAPAAPAPSAVFDAWGRSPGDPNYGINPNPSPFDNMVSWGQ